MNSRPNAFETEEDILKQQEEFFKNKVSSSVKVIKTENDLSIPMNIDKNVVKKIQLIPPHSNLIGNIIERKTTSATPISNRFTTFSTGFPQAKKRQITTNTHKGSIFSQQNKKSKEITRENPVQHDKSDITKVLSSCSYILTGKESEEIHKENLNALSKMSEQEILEEQNKLLNSLDPDIVKFLKAKRKKIENESIKMEVEEETFSESVVSVEEIDTPKEMIEYSSEKWLHFKDIETEKLQWMKNIEIPKELENGQPYEARFDFAGWLLPYVEPEISEDNRILYHHGEEPGRPGYTLKELFKLSRSNVNQQRILALNTIANILSLQSTGLYDDVIDIPIEQIFFVIRICLDDNSPPILNASIKAMHHLFYYQIDETCLDSLMGFGLSLVQPMLTVEKEDCNKEDEKEINDQQLAEMDLVKCLARTDILVRIRYIINTVKPTSETINYCLELLIRLMRDSHLIMTQVYNCEDLFKSIIQHFVPKIYKLEIVSNYCYGYPVLSAIKLLRIAASRSKTIASELIKKYDIMNSICSYIANDIGNTTIGVKIQIEAFHLFAVFLYYNLGIEYFSELSPFLIRTIDYHLKNTNIDEKSSFTIQSHFAAVMNIVSHASLINSNLIVNFVPLLMRCLAKYCNQVSNLIDFKCGKLQIISSLFTTLKNVMKSASIKHDSNIESIIHVLLSSTGFNTITCNIKIGSNLLCSHEVHKCGANFSSVEAAVWKTTEHVIPSLLTKSSIPFLSSLSSFIETCNNKIVLKFLFHPNIQKYLILLNTSEKFALSSNWFSKVESQLLINILRCAINTQKDLPDQKIFYELSVKCLNIFKLEQKADADFIFKNIIFNKDFFPKELLFDHLCLNENKHVVNNILKYLNEIYQCYSEIIGLNKNLFLLSSALTIDYRIGNIVPVDWVFSPLVILYAEHQDTSKKVDEKREIFIVTRCLQWIFLYENYFSELSAYVNPTDRFCRLSCVFLCDNSLFLENEIHQLLELCFKMLLKPYNFNNINFDKEIQGLNNFQDFYVQLLEQYQGVSYGDILFANFILMPLIQKQNVKWRKIFWSEYMGTAQTITLDVDQCLIPISEFLNPPENELSILKCYRRALTLNYLKRSLFLQHITQHHVDYYIENKQ